MLSKEEYTRQVLEQMPPDDRPSYDQALKYWWQDIRDEGGLRLSMSGYDAFDYLDLTRYEFDVPAGTPARPAHLITLNKKLTHPYYLKMGKKPKLILFGSTEAVMMAMYGDLEKFIKYLNRT